MPADPVVAGYLAAVADDLDAARRLAAPPANRLAAYHLRARSVSGGKFGKGKPGKRR
jgi:hypothetical protein